MRWHSSTWATFKADYPSQGVPGKKELTNERTDIRAHRHELHVFLNGKLRIDQPFDPEHPLFVPFAAGAAQAVARAVIDQWVAAQALIAELQATAEQPAE